MAPSNHASACGTTGFRVRRSGPDVPWHPDHSEVAWPSDERRTWVAVLEQLGGGLTL